MKTFSEYCTARLAEYGHFSGDDIFTSKIVWDDSHKAWYDENGSPFDEGILHQFLIQQALAYSAHEFEINIEVNDTGHHFPATAVLGPVDRSDPGSYDKQRHVGAVTLYADGKDVPLSSGLRRAFLSHFQRQIDRMQFQH
jgi:hypothetical protein